METLSREEGTVRKAWGGRIPVALIYPNLYATGMDNLGFQLVYRMLNREEDLVCERAFLPEGPEDGRGRERPEPLSLESQQPLGRFEILAFSIPFENDYPHVLEILDASGIPLEARRRPHPQPMIWAGGVTAALNPEPLAPFVDLFAVGEAEAVLPGLLDEFRKCRTERLDKHQALNRLSCVEGVYVPALYQVRYDTRGLIRSFRPRGPAPVTVRRKVARDLSRWVPASHLLTPDTGFQSMFLVEIGRGCPRACRFCAAGHVFHPTRHRRLEDLLPALEEGMARRGRIGLVSSSVGDHPQIAEICREILSRGGKVSVSSVRLDALSPDLLEALVQSGHRTLSLGPEAGSQRLRDLIHKDLTEGQILEGAGRIAAAGVPALRLYFMVGLPTETMDDVEAVAALTRKILHAGRVASRGRGLERVTLSLNPFVPKPATPFQWHPFMDVRDLKARIQHIRRALRRERAVQVIHEPPKWARVQALLARGDRRVGRVLMEVARGTGWDEALRQVNLNPDFYLHRRREASEILPWDFIDQGIPKSSLWRIYQRAVGSGSGREG
jgi:radical SAM superfamily enzyme YgiQ (UPF0313 family)